MLRLQRLRILTLVCATLGLLVLPIVATAQPSGKKEFAFRGKVEKVDAKAKTLTVNGENVPGWMAAMTMSYAVDKEDVLTKVKAGDTITARVYDGDVKTLYNVQVVGQEKK
jgi:Cu/Ag efflux protein CusF